MATNRELGQAIELIQQGNKEAGAMMLNALLKRRDLDNANRAVGYVWLAETRDDIHFKIQCLNQAKDADPNNQAISQRLNKLLAQQPRSTPYPVQRPPQEQQQPQQNTSANPMLPDSQPINLPSPDMSDSQQMRTIGNNDSDTRRTTGRQRVSDPDQRSRIMDRISPPDPTGDTGQLPTLDSMGDRWTTNSMPAANPPDQRPRQQPNPFDSPNPNSPPSNPYNQPNRDNFNNQPEPPADPFGQQNRQNRGDSKPQNPFNQPPPPQQQQRSRAPHHLSQTPQVVGIRHGANGNGSGVFVTTDGIIATTRYVVGGLEQVRVEIDTNYETTGQVIRTYPAMDLALIHVNVELDRVWPPTQMPVLADGEAFVSISYGRDVIRANHRSSKSDIERYWIPTTAKLMSIKSAGGDAMFDNNNYLIGILTRNASRETGYVYGLHISYIYERVREYLRERQQMPNSGYCHHCGSLTRAELYGGYYCETCGALRPNLENVDRPNRSSQQLLQIYNENLSRTCPRCSARVGYYNAKCLRCGYDLEGRK